jgi:hypothetical protein
VLYPGGREGQGTSFFLDPDPTVQIIPDPVPTSGTPYPGITRPSKKNL